MVGVEIQLHVPATEERAPDTHWTGGWVLHRAGMNAVENRKIYFSCQESNPNSSAVQLEACGCTENRNNRNGYERMPISGTSRQSC
jgi:hypothetical protein